MPLLLAAQPLSVPARNSQNPARSYEFASGQSALKIPFELSNNLVLLQAEVNDSQPLWFIFDTGASASIIDSQLVEKLKLRVGEKAKGNATGGAIEAKLIQGVSLAVPGTKPLLPSQSMAPLRCLVNPSAGLSAMTLSSNSSSKFTTTPK
jgi:Aspartyl protease